jgi:hypothetical protein
MAASTFLESQVQTISAWPWLYAAVAGLVDPIKALTDDVIRTAPSLYEQLVGSIPTAKREGMGRLAGRSVPPVWTDALDLRIEIDDTARGWQPDQVCSTPTRLRGLAAKRWRPQDTSGVEKIAGRVESWAVSVQSLLSATSVKHVSAAVPGVRSDVRLSKRLGRRTGTGAGAADRHRARLHLPGLRTHPVWPCSTSRRTCRPTEPVIRHVIT